MCCPVEVASSLPMASPSFWYFGTKPSCQGLCLLSLKIGSPVMTSTCGTLSAIAAWRQARLVGVPSPAVIAKTLPLSWS